LAQREIRIALTVTLGWLPQAATVSQSSAPSNSLLRYRDAGTAVGQWGAIKKLKVMEACKKQTNRYQFCLFLHRNCCVFPW